MRGGARRFLSPPPCGEGEGWGWFDRVRALENDAGAALCFIDEEQSSDPATPTPTPPRKGEGRARHILKMIPSLAFGSPVRTGSMRLRSCAAVSLTHNPGMSNPAPGD